VANDESTFQNYSNVNEPQSTGKGDPGAVGQDHNSVGVFQQQPHINGSAAWLPYPEAMSVAEQAAAYYGANPKSKNPGVFQVDPKGTMDPGSLAQKVQQSGTPQAYYPLVQFAKNLYGQHGANTPAAQLGFTPKSVGPDPTQQGNIPASQAVGPPKLSSKEESMLAAHKDLGWANEKGAFSDRPVNGPVPQPSLTNNPLGQKPSGNEGTLTKTGTPKSKIPALRQPTDKLHGDSVAAHATSLLGTPHAWGGDIPGTGLDVAGLIHHVYAAHGVQLPPTTYEMAGVGTGKTLGQALPGDIILQDASKNGLVDGGGIYLGGGNMVTTKPGGAVAVDRVSNGGRVVTVRNVGGQSDHPPAPTWGSDGGTLRANSAPAPTRRPSSVSGTNQNPTHPTTGAPPKQNPVVSHGAGRGAGRAF
jgi:cell wall-associated NlpC family hydrolase